LSFATRFVCSLEPGAVIQVDGDQQQDSFDHIERETGAGKAE
jgi:hypothetical protein